MAWKEARLLQEVRNATSNRRLLSETSLKLKNICSLEDTLLTDGENCYRLGKENQILKQAKRDFHDGPWLRPCARFQCKGSTSLI